MIKTVYELHLLASTTNTLNLLTSTIHENIFSIIDQQDTWHKRNSIMWKIIYSLRSII